MFGLLNQFYPEREITVTSTDPHYVTPAVKAMLRRKNRLMHAGRTVEVGALAARIHLVLLPVMTVHMRAARAPASTVRPACIKRFFRLDIALTAGVT